MTGDATANGFDQLFAAADDYHQQFQPDELSAAPTRNLVVLTCMDARLDLFRLLRLEIGDAHLLRNAGGRATEFQPHNRPPLFTARPKPQPARGYGGPLSTA